MAKSLHILFIYSISISHYIKRFNNNLLTWFGGCDLHRTSCGAGDDKVFPSLVSSSSIRRFLVNSVALMRRDKKSLIFQVSFLTSAKQQNSFRFLSVLSVFLVPGNLERELSRKITTFCKVQIRVGLHWA